MRLRAVLFAIILFMPIFAFSGISGRYKMFGTRADSSTYRGTAKIKKVGNAVYSITWTFSDGSVDTGTGVQKGNQISFVFNEENTIYGVILYTIEDHELKGPYTILGQTQKGFEKLKKI